MSNLTSVDKKVFITKNLTLLKLVY